MRVFKPMILLVPQSISVYWISKKELFRSDVYIKLTILDENDFSLRSDSSSYECIKTHQVDSRWMDGNNRNDLDTYIDT